MEMLIFEKRLWMGGKQMKKWDKKEFNKKLHCLQPLIMDCQEKSLNEAGTRWYLEKILVELLGYEKLEDLTTELMIRGAGTDHLDYAVKIKGQIKFIIEAKSVCTNLGEKHLRQVLSYGANSGMEWCLLTNSVEWELYHITFMKPIKLDSVLKFNFLKDSPDELYEKMYHLTKKRILKDGLDKLWQKEEVLSIANIVKTFLSPSTLNAIKRTLRQETKVAIPIDEIIGGFRKVLNEKALVVLNDMDISFSEKKHRRKTHTKKEDLLMTKEDTPQQKAQTEKEDSQL